MPRHLVYLDESGDTGWTFTKPFRAGGSSRFLVIAAIILPEELNHLPSRIVRDMYSKYGWKTDREKKGSEMSGNQCLHFAAELQKMLDANPGIIVRALTVRKERVQDHIRSDSNKLYNYMVKLLVSDYLATCSDVELLPDERSIKVQSGNSLEDYLSIDQWFEKKSKVKLVVKPSNSEKTLQIRVVDFLANLIFRFREDGLDVGFSALSAKSKVDMTLFF